MPRSRAKRNQDLEEEETDVYEVDISSRPQRTHVAHVDEASRGGRRVRRNNVPFYTPASPKKPPPQPPRAASPERSQWMHMICEEDDVDDPVTVPPPSEGGTSKSSRRRAQNVFVTLEHDRVLLDWEKEKEAWLAELLRREGPGGADLDVCPACKKTPQEKPSYRCDDCHGAAIVCRQCCLAQHSRLPFHRVKRWNGTFFDRVTLQDVGVYVQLGHANGEICVSPAYGPRASLVFHTSGLHPITLLFCHCDNAAHAGDKVQQLLRAGLYPATSTDPTTFFTFQMLEQFHILTLQGKLTAYDYYLSLVKLTDNTGLSRRYDRLKSFLRVVREWRHLKMLKRAGRGHIPGGVRDVPAGALALRCPACPDPSRNLPANWNCISDDLKYIYTMFIAIDANFRLKRRAVSNNARDPGLISGGAFFVETSAYEDYVLKYADEADMSTCTGFKALLHANTRWNKGYAQTGVAMAVCARHGFVLPNGVVDLQKGERYCSMDYVVASALALQARGIPVVLSYDIVCQWLKNRERRWMADTFPVHLRIELPEGEVRYAIPKYHFNGHKEEGHNQFSLNLRKGSSRTDGEEIERGWFRHEGTATSTREMGPGSRHDTLEDHFQWSNHLKYTDMGSSLFRRHKKARAEATKFKSVFEEFSQGLDAANIAQWVNEADAWEADTKRDDPYFVPPSGLTEADIRLQLAEQDDKEAAEGKFSLHEMSPASMLGELLDIEDQQRRFQLKYPRGADGAPQRTLEVLEKRAALRRRVNAVRLVQAVYMPPVAQLLARYQLVRRTAASEDGGTLPARMRRRQAVQDEFVELYDPAEEQPLYLPSSLDSESRSACEDGLVSLEDQLREGQLRDSLDKLRVQLHVKARLVTFKQRNIRHQGSLTRAMKRLDTNEEKIKVFAEKYRAAHRAKLSLVGPGDWTREWRTLEHKHVRCMREAEPLAGDEPSGGASEGTRTVSWIWMAADRNDGEVSAGSMKGMAEALKSEYLRSRARHLRFDEEDNTLGEEKRRVLESLERNAEDWDGRRAAVDSLYSDGLVRHGAAAYASRQAAYHRGLKLKFSGMWSHGSGSTATRDEGREPEEADSRILVSYAAAESDDDHGVESEDSGSDWSDNE